MSAEVREIAYDDNPNFNDNLDQTYTSGLEELSPGLTSSWLLFNTDYDLYLTLFDEYNETQREEFINTVYESFSMPIAYYLRQTQLGARDSNEQLQLLRSTWEAIIFVLYAVVISEARKYGFHLRSMNITE